MKFEIKNRWNGELIFSIETDTWKLAIEAAVKTKANLRSADLRFADLRSANLRSANLSFADLRSADLRSANLRSANLSFADLRSADLRSADLRSADLRSANLRSANLSFADLRSANLSFADLSSADLRSADLRSADLRSADLRSADLRSANLSFADLSSANLRSANLSFADLSFADLTEKQLTTFRDDLWAVLCSSPFEVEGLKQALIDGKVDGSTYTGECSCLIGTIAKVAHTNYESLPNLKPDSGRPAEVFFTLIKKGDTPKKSKWSKMAVQWIEEWTGTMRSAFSEVKK